MFANKMPEPRSDAGSGFTQMGCRPPPVAGLKTSTPVCDCALFAVTETSTSPELIGSA
jgi:hypothetical protein